MQHREIAALVASRYPGRGQGQLRMYAPVFALIIEDAFCQVLI
jgi:hypothetical protein